MRRHPFPLRRAKDQLQRNPVVLETLAVAYASAGNYGQAAMVAQQAMDMAIENALPQLAKRIGVRLEQYKKVELE